MEDMEGENDRLSTEVMELQQLVKTGQGSNDSSQGAQSSGTNKEIDKLKNQIMEKNKEIQHLTDALTQSEKNKGKVVVQRSRSLENESALDLKVILF